MTTGKLLKIKHNFHPFCTGDDVRVIFATKRILMVKRLSDGAIGRVSTDDVEQIADIPEAHALNFIENAIL